MAIKEQEIASADALNEMCIMQCVGHHERLVELLDVTVSDNIIKLVLEYLSCSLTDIWLRTRGFIEWDLCYKYSREILEAVEFIHSQGVAHCDISLSNILVDSRSNCAKLGDLGMAAAAATFVFDRTVAALPF